MFILLVRTASIILQECIKCWHHDQCTMNLHCSHVWLYICQRGVWNIDLACLHLRTCKCWGMKIPKAPDNMFGIYNGWFLAGLFNHLNVGWSISMVTRGFQNAKKKMKISAKEPINMGYFRIAVSPTNGCTPRCNVPCGMWATYTRLFC